MSPSEFGGDLADFDRRASSDGSCSSGRNPGGWICRGGASPGTDRAFGSGKALVGSLQERMPVMEPLGACDSGDSLSMGATRTLLCPTTWTLILSGWRPGTLAGRSALVAGLM